MRFKQSYSAEEVSEFCADRKAASHCSDSPSLDRCFCRREFEHRGAHGCGCGRTWVKPIAIQPMEKLPRQDIKTIKAYLLNGEENV